MHVAWEDEQMHGRLRIQVIGNNKISRLQENVALCLRLWILGESGERVQSRGDGWFWRLREGRRQCRRVPCFQTYQKQDPSSSMQFGCANCLGDWERNGLMTS